MQKPLPQGSLDAMSCLSFDELKTLWGEITIGYMLNYDCYNNSLGVNRVEVEHYATGFLDALNDNDEYPEFMENSPENFATYCCWSE